MWVYHHLVFRMSALARVICRSAEPAASGKNRKGYFPILSNDFSQGSAQRLIFPLSKSYDVIYYMFYFFAEYAGEFR